MASSLAWLVPSGVAFGALTVSTLTYRIVRRTNQVSWAVELQPDPKAGVSLWHVIATRRTGPSAREVTISLDSPQQWLTGSPQIKEPPPVPRVDAGGQVRWTYQGLYAHRPPSFATIKWRGRFGRSKSWTSGL